MKSGNVTKFIAKPDIRANHPKVTTRAKWVLTEFGSDELVTWQAMCVVGERCTPQEPITRVFIRHNAVLSTPKLRAQ